MLMPLFDTYIKINKNTVYIYIYICIYIYIATDRNLEYVFGNATKVPVDSVSP